MKQLIKLKQLIIITLLFSAFACQDDEVVIQSEQLDITKSEFVIKIESGDHLRTINPDLYQRLTESSQMLGSLVQSEDGTAESFILDLNRVQIIERNTYTQYTTSVIDHSDYETDLINYLLLDFDDGTQYQYLVKYPRITTDQGIKLDRINAIMGPIAGDILLQSESGVGGSRPCLEGAAEIVNSYQIYQCTEFRCTGDGHSIGEECNCGQPGYSCTTAFKICGWETANVWGCSGGGTSGSGSTGPTGGGNDTIPDDPNEDDLIETIPFVPYWERVVNCVNDGAMGSFDDSLPLTSSDINWLQSQSGTVHANAMSDFIDSNNCNLNKGFLDKAVEKIRLGGKFDKENGVILDPSFVGTRAECAYNKIKSTNGTLYKKTIDLFTNDPKYKLLLTVGNCLNTDIACTDGSEVDTTGTVKIIVEDLGEPTLELIATLLHEAIHAEIFRYVSRHQSGVDPNDRPRLLQLYQYYKGLAGNPNYTGDPVTDAQHTFMAENYVIPIAQAIREIDGNSHPLEYYMWYGWEGLETYDFQNKLTPALRQQYNQYQSTVNGSTTVNCN